MGFGNLRVSILRFFLVFLQMRRLVVANPSGCCPKRYALLVRMPRLCLREAWHLFCRGVADVEMGTRLFGGGVVVSFSSSFSLKKNIFLSLFLSLYI